MNKLQDWSIDEIKNELGDLHHHIVFYSIRKNDLGIEATYVCFLFYFKKN